MQCTSILNPSRSTGIKVGVVDTLFLDRPGVSSELDPDHVSERNDQPIKPLTKFFHVARMGRDCLPSTSGSITPIGSSKFISPPLVIEHIYRMERPFEAGTPENFGLEKIAARAGAHRAIPS